MGGGGKRRRWKRLRLSLRGKRRSVEVEKKNGEKHRKKQFNLTKLHQNALVLCDLGQPLALILGQLVVVRKRRRRRGAARGRALARRRSARHSNEKEVGLLFGVSGALQAACS